jgi:hypothetical protein
MKSFFRSRTAVFGPERIFEELEPRIVLDASVDSSGHDHPLDSHDFHGLFTQAVADNQPADHSDSGGTTGDAPDTDFNVVLISNALPELSMLSKAAADHAQVLIFDSAKDNLDTINVRLHDMVASSGQKIDHLAVLDHAKAGEWRIGTDRFNLFSLPSRRASFEALGNLLSDAGQIQLYGCSLAGDPMGQALVDRMALYTHADVFASFHKVGGNSRIQDTGASSEAVAPVIQSEVVVNAPSPPDADFKGEAQIEAATLDPASQTPLSHETLTVSFAAEAPADPVPPEVALPAASAVTRPVRSTAEFYSVPFMFQPLQPGDPPVIVTEAEEMKVDGQRAQTIPEIQVYDPSSRFVDVVLTASHGGLSVPNPLQSAGLVEVRGNNGVNVPMLRLSGFFNDLNDTLKQVTYKPAVGYAGSDELAIQLHSRGIANNSATFVPLVEKALPIEVSKP